MMACTALMTQTTQPAYTNLLCRNGEQPGVRQLQHWLETAWHAGYDREGAAHFKYNIVGTRKWIGTGDLLIVFSYLGIPARLVDFRKDRNAPAALQEWVKNYFSAEENSRPVASAFDALNSSPVLTTNKLPIILQHAGHSRSIVGYERDRKDGINLLVLDPAKNVPEDARRLCLSCFTGEPTPSPTKKGPAAFVEKMMKRGAGEGAEDRAGKRAKGIGGDAVHAGSSSMLEEKNASVILSAFRINLKNLSRKDEYQVLYFPMEPPLSESEKEKRKVVKSEIGC